LNLRRGQYNFRIIDCLTHPTAALHPPTTLREVIASSMGCSSGLGGNEAEGSEDFERTDCSIVIDGLMRRDDDGEFMITARR